MFSKPFILQLPLEVCEKLVADSQLSRQDIRSLRLTCKALAAIARPTLLYGQVVLSRLKEDRDEFDEIVKHHGRHVNEVVWQGLDLESWSQSPGLWHYIQIQAGPNGVVASVARNPNLLWIPILFTSADIWQASAEYIGRQFESMPNMTTLTVKPMPDIRTFCKNINEGHIFRSDIHYLNAQFDFVLALYALRQPRCRVRTLNLDTRFRRPDIWNVSLHDPQAFQHLTTINICSSPSRRVGIITSGTLLDCLRRAGNLRSLKLCFSEVPSKRYLFDPDEDPKNFLRGLFDQGNWPHLHSLHIVNAPSFVVIGSLPGLRLPGLRNLTLDDCCVKYQWIDSIRTQQMYPHLKSITIRAQDIVPRNNFPKNPISEARMLAFLRNEVVDLAYGMNNQTQGEIVTDTTVPLCELCSYCNREN